MIAERRFCERKLWPDRNLSNSWQEFLLFTPQKSTWFVNSRILRLAQGRCVRREALGSSTGVYLRVETCQTGNAQIHSPALVFQWNEAFMSLHNKSTALCLWVTQHYQLTVCHMIYLSMNQHTCDSSPHYDTTPTGSLIKWQSNKLQKIIASVSTFVYLFL